jgi:hypothetical protein
MPTHPEKRSVKRKTPEGIGDAVRQWMSVFAERLDLRCVALGPGCRNPDTDLDLTACRIAEIDFFGVGDRIESARLEGFTAGWAHFFQERRLVLAAVNGPYRTAFPAVPTLVLHLTLWPTKWLTKVCPFVVNGFRKAQVFVGSRPGALVPPRKPSAMELLQWHYGLENCLRYIHQEGFEAPTWWIDDRSYDGRAVFHDLSDPYRMTEFIAYALNGALCNVAHFPALLLPSTSRTRPLAATFRRRAIEARNGAPVAADWLARHKPAAISAIEILIREIGAAL